MTRIPSLRRHLIARLLWLIVPLVLGGMALHWHFESALLEDQFDQSLAEKAATLATLVTEDRGELELNFADEYMPQFSRREQPYYFQIRRPDGRSLERSASLLGEDLPFVRGPLQRPARFEATLRSGVRLRCVGIEFPLRLGSDSGTHSAASVVIVLGAEQSALAGTLQQGMGEVALAGLASIIAISVAVLFALRRGVALLEEVADQVDSITPTTLTEPLDVSQAPVEIRPIMASLKRALESLAKHVEREMRFTSDVAHELRTPIAELRAAAEIALKWPDDASTRRLAGEAHAIALQMAGLVESLLALAQLESRGAVRLHEHFDLSRSLGLLVEQAQKGEVDGRTILLDAPGELTMASDPHLWELTLRNLLDNALSYSPPGSRVTLLARGDLDGALVRVSNPTDALDSEGAARCTDRLWRAHRRPDETSHFGLGLSLVAAATTQLGHHFAVRLDAGVFHATISRAQTPPSDLLATPGAHCGDDSREHVRPHPGSPASLRRENDTQDEAS